MVSILNTHILLQFLLVSFTMGLPVEDTQLVGSSIHGVTAKPPSDLLAAGDHSGYHSGGDDGDEGYIHTHANKGDDGYKKYDTFHKKDGDSYGYEKHTSFGNADGDGTDGEYHESSSYSDGDEGDEGYGTSSKPKFTSYHYESSSGTPKDYSNYNPEAPDEDDESTNVKSVSLAPAESRRVHKDVEITAPLKGQKFQSLLDVSGENPLPKKKSIKKRSKNNKKDSKASGTEGDTYYDSYHYEGDEGDAGDEGDEAEYEGSYYEGEGESSYHPEAEAEGSSEFY